MQTNTMKQLFTDMGLNIERMGYNEPVPVSGWEIQTVDDTGTPVWKNILHAVRKPNAEHMRVTSENGNVLDCSPEHRIFVKDTRTKAEAFREVWQLRKCFQFFQVRTEAGWETFQVEHLSDEIEVLDVEVEGTHHYLSNGIVSHNTMYGDPSTTPGGMAIPYHASVRLKLTGGQQIKQTINGKEAVIGINVNVKTIKNKVARPWREVSFEIHFGKGIKESEQLFDELREFCEKSDKPIVTPDGKRVKVEGMGSWKVFSVTDTKTGEIIHEVKFYKSEFESKVLNVEEFKPYVTFLMDATFIMTNGEEPHKTLASIDMSSAAEVEALKVERELKRSGGKNLLLD